MPLRFALIALLPLALLMTGCGDDGDGGDPGDELTPNTQLFSPAPGTTWSMDMSGATWVSPEDVEDLVELMTTDYPVLLSVTANDGQIADAMLGTGTADGQIMCNRTVAAQGLTVSDTGDLTFNAESFSLANGLTVRSLVLSMTLDADGHVASMDAQGHVEMSSIPADLLPLTDGQSACDLADGIGIPCEVCPAVGTADTAETAPDCVAVNVTGITGATVEGLALEAVTEADCHPECAENSETCDTTGW